MTIDIITGYTFDAGYTFGAHCMEQISRDSDHARQWHLTWQGP